MLIGHVVVYDDLLWVYAGSIDAPAAYSGGPSHSNYELAPLRAFASPTQRRYVQDPKPGSIVMLPACESCGVPDGWRCTATCPVGTEDRKP